MNIRKFDANQDYNDYLDICSWWLKHNWPIINYEMLPSTGFIVEGYCAGFLYKNDSKLAILEFIVSNPEADKQKRSEALDLLLQALINEAKESGYKAIFSSLSHPGLIDRYVKHGFEVTDTTMTNLMRIF